MVGAIFQEYYEPYSWDDSYFVHTVISWVVIPMLFVYFVTAVICGVFAMPVAAGVTILGLEYIFQTLLLFWAGLQGDGYRDTIVISSIPYPKTWRGIFWFVAVGLWVPLMFVAMPASRLFRWYRAHSANWPDPSSGKSYLR